MKIGICGIDNGKYGRYGDGAFGKMRYHGFEALDYNTSDTDSELYSLPVSELTRQLSKLKSACGDAGIEICQIHGPWRWPPRDFSAEDRLERLGKMKRSIDMAAILGVSNWVVHPIMPYGIEDIGSGNENATWELNVEFMSELLSHAKKNGVVICLENMPMPKFSLGAPKAILDFARSMNDDNFKICLDVGHVTVYRELDIYEETKRLGSYIRCLHVHDSNQERDLHLFPRFGRTDWEGFMRALSEIGYDGVFCLETCPPSQLCDELFEDSAKLLYRIAKELVDTI